MVDGTLPEDESRTSRPPNHAPESAEGDGAPDVGPAASPVPVSPVPVSPASAFRCPDVPKRRFPRCRIQPSRSPLSRSLRYRRPRRRRMRRALRRRGVPGGRRLDAGRSRPSQRRADPGELVAPVHLGSTVAPRRLPPPVGRGHCQPARGRRRRARDPLPGRERPSRDRVPDGAARDPGKPRLPPGRTAGRSLGGPLAEAHRHAPGRHRPRAVAAHHSRRLVVGLADDGPGPRGGHRRRRAHRLLRRVVPVLPSVPGRARTTS